MCINISISISSSLLILSYGNYYDPSVVYIDTKMGKAFWEIGQYSAGACDALIPEHVPDGIPFVVYDCLGYRPKI